jgi:hypothetical protein
MRITTVRLAGLAALVALLLGGVGLGQQSGRGDVREAAKKAVEEIKPSQLEELIAQALRDNPDVRVAEAKMREAEAELSRVRLQVIQKVVAHQHNTETKESAVQNAEAHYVVAQANQQLAKAEYDRVAEISKKGVVAKADVDAARAKVEQAAADVQAAKSALQAAKADLAKTQAELPYLLGKGGKDGHETEAVRRGLAWLQANQADTTARALYALSLAQAEQAWFKAGLQPQGTVAETLRKALDRPINLSLQNVPTAKAIEDIRDFAGVSIVPSSTLPRELLTRPITLKLDNVRLGAVFQLLEDATGLQFGVRDYGILMAGQLPPDVMPLHRWWKDGEKSKAGEEKPKARPEKPGASGKNPPPANVEGTVTKVDAADGLVEISVGTDAGLAAGQTLEVYRTAGDPGPRYLGTLRIVQAQSTRSVGKFLKAPTTPVAVGDRASARLE